MPGARRDSRSRELGQEFQQVEDLFIRHSSFVSGGRQGTTDDGQRSEDER